MNTFRDWIIANYEHNVLADICNQGCVNGFQGITYYSETEALYDKYNTEIWEWISNNYDEYGFESPLQFISSLNGAKDIDDDMTFKNILVWTYVERVAYEITQGEYISEPTN